MRRLAVTLLVVAALAAPVALILLAVPGATPPVRELFPMSPWALHQALPLPVAARGGGRLVTRFVLEGGDERVLRYTGLGLSFSTSGTAPRLHSGVVRLRGSGCEFAAMPERPVPDGGVLWFLPQEGCSRPTRLPSGTLDVEIVLADPQPLRLWVVLGVQGPSYAGLPARLGALSIADPGAGLARAVARLPLASSPARRADLLGRMWGLRGRQVVWMTVSLMAIAFVSATAGLLGGIADNRSATARRWWIASSSGMLAFAVAGTYAVIVPPLQAPDEPWHFLGFAEVTRDDSLAPALAHWAQRTHFERIRFRPDQRLTSADLLEPYPVSWDVDGGAAPTSVRSALAVGVYRALAPLAGTVPVERKLLRIRFALSALFGIAVGIATAIVVTAAEGTGAVGLAGIGPLTVPAVPFFAMYLSETGPLVCVYTVLAGAVGAWWWRGGGAPMLGVTLGICSAGLLAGGRSAWPVLLVIALLAGTRVVEAWRGWRSAFLFWGGLLLPLLALPFARVQAMLAAAFGQNSLIQAPGAASLTVRDFWISLLALAAVLPMLERLSTGLASKIVPQLPWRSWARAVASAGIVLAGLSLATSLLVAFPRLPLVDPVPAPLGSPLSYMTRAVVGMALTFRLTQPDFLLFSSFWTGFGWLDAMPPHWFLTALVLGLAAAVVRMLWHLADRDPGSRLLRLGILGLGTTAALCLATVALVGMRTSLHGRYLIGWWMLALAPVWMGGLVVPGRSPAAWWPRVVLAAVGAVHVYCLTFLLTRYF